MKKTIVLLVLSIAMCSTVFAQKNLEKRIDKRVDTYVERVESNMTLSDKEKKTLVSLREAHAIAFYEIKEKYEKGSAENKEKRKENNREFARSLNEAFGKARAKEIKNASRKN
ncbi:hypothetical protein ITJ86_02550 [Winogradskyella sp. F6397]|uniref:DUF4890 domain-containing protein n=1 Tax=Winogradskyella marina TaxID=2785530 RepID=A0ABS0EEA1_9FLAO|nr:MULTISPECIES: hypothetical protein [Winogradskyella]MBF8148759.1 hypothetical protein [Winogradskyella marina]